MATRLAAAHGRAAGAGLPDVVAQFQLAGRVCEELAAQLGGAVGAADHFAARVLAGGTTSGSAAGPAGGAAGGDGAGNSGGPAWRERGQRGLVPGRHYVRRDGAVVRNRKVDASGAAVPRLAWDVATGTYVEVRPVVPAVHRPPMAAFVAVTDEHRARLAAVQAMRARVKALRDGIAGSGDPVIATDRDRLTTAARHTLTTVSETMGSLAGDAYMESAYANRGTTPPVKLYEGSGPGTLDQVWRVTLTGPTGAGGADGLQAGELHVVLECKGGASPLGKRDIGAQAYQQGTLEYLKDVLAVMQRRGTIEERTLALQLSRALRGGTLEYVHVHAVPHADGVPRIRAGRFDLNTRGPNTRNRDATTPGPPDGAGS